MINKLICLLFLTSLCLVSAQEGAKKACGPNSVFDKCANEGCENTCEEPKKRTYCASFTCSPGCMCNPGYVLGPNGGCILLSSCPATTITCGKNSAFSKCANLECENTCYNPTNRDTCKSFKCTPGCACIKGNVLDSNNECIPINECPDMKIQCGKNEIFNRCGSCDGTCDNSFPSCKSIKVCRRGCFCKEGYVRNSFGDCIPESKCQACPKKNFQWRLCGTCDGSCENPVKYCKIQCQEGCFCRKGFLMDNQDNCISPNECK